MITSVGIGGVAIAYIIYRDYKFTDRIANALDEITDIVKELKK